MIKICRSCLAATLAALMLTVPIVAVDDPGNQAAGKEREITEVRLTLKDGKELPKYIGSELTNLTESIEKKFAQYVSEKTNQPLLGDRILKDVQLEYVNKQGEKYKDKIFWPIKKTDNGYVFDHNKELCLKITLKAGEDDGNKYKIDVAKELPVKIGGRQFTIPANGLKEGQDGTYTAYLPLKAYRKVKFIPDEGFTKFNLKGKTPELTKSLEYDVDLEAGKLDYPNIKNNYFEEKIDDAYAYLGLFVNAKKNNKYFCNMTESFVYLNLDELNKGKALETLVVNVRTKKKDGTSLIPPAINGQDATIEEGKKFNLLSLVKSFREEAGTDRGDINNIQFAYDRAKFNPDNPAPGKYDIIMSFKNKANGQTATWTSTVIVRAKQKPPVPAPQPQPKQQEKTGNAYFDLGRYLLPPCPDSKCAKTETSAKKDDVPNTAAAVNN